jgi:sterol desaturase/sphingolipid hydroxylase (fatty acid hydroxylase superfamily)
MSFTNYVFLFGIFLFFAELILPRNKFPKVQKWYPRAIILNIIGLSTVYLYGVYSSDFIDKYRLWDASTLGLTGSVLVGLLIVTFFNYWWHRLRHYSSFFWRWFHQIHHSAQRLEVITTFYKHPLEATVDTVLTIPIIYIVAGLQPYAASIVLAIMGGGGIILSLEY